MYQLEFGFEIVKFRNWKIALTRNSQIDFFALHPVRIHPIRCQIIYVIAKIGNLTFPIELFPIKRPAEAGRECLGT